MLEFFFFFFLMVKRRKMEAKLAVWHVKIKEREMRRYGRVSGQ